MTKSKEVWVGDSKLWDRDWETWGKLMEDQGYFSRSVYTGPFQC